MRKKNYKGRCRKRIIEKCAEVCRTYDDVQYAYADILQRSDDIAEIQCNIPIEGSEYTTDFVCTRTDGEIIVRECVFRKLLSRPSTAELLDKSREYWLNHGVTNWGIVTDEEI